jgi:CheY-like chemotaxis protein
MTMAQRPLRILVVDDDPAMVGAITALVGTEGHQEALPRGVARPRAA